MTHRVPQRRRENALVKVQSLSALRKRAAGASGGGATPTPGVLPTYAGRGSRAADSSVTIADIRLAEPKTTQPAAPTSRLERRALALMTDTAANALLGIVFWAAAARLYSPAEVGRGSALISAATLLATLSQLNLGNVYARFLGSAGHRQRRLVFAGFGVVAGLAILLGTVYATLGPSSVLFASSGQAWAFPFCVAVLAVFVLQDMILVSLGKASWVPVENISWGIVKLVVLVALATSLPELGIGLAWILPAVVAAVAVTGYLALRRWRAEPGKVAFPTRRDLGKEIAGEYVTGLISTAVPLALPLLVVHILGLEANAYFAVPWLFATSLSLLMWNVAAVLLVEASAAPERRPVLLKKALRLALAVAVAGGVAIWFLGPLILSILGSGYAEHSTWLLRCTAVSAPAVAVVVVWTTAARSAGRIRRVMVLQLAIGAVLIGLAAALIGRVGVVGVGIAYLTAQVGAAVVLIRPLATMIRPKRLSRRR